MRLNRANLRDAAEWFHVLQTTKVTQTAVMTLAPGQSTGDEAEAHAESEQTLLLIDGELRGESDKKSWRLVPAM
jgi:quercetin dioxygenase-like cupin family protein